MINIETIGYFRKSPLLRAVVAGHWQKSPLKFINFALSLTVAAQAFNLGAYMIIDIYQDFSQNRDPVLDKGHLITDLELKSRHVNFDRFKCKSRGRDING